MSRWNVLLGVMAAGVGCVAGSAGGQTVDARLIALRGSPGVGAPAGPSGNAFLSFVNMAYPALADNGDVYFGGTTAFLSNGGFDRDWVNRGSVNAPMFTPNEPVAELPGSIYYGLLSSPVLGAEGQLLYVADVRGPVSGSSLVLDAAGGRQLVARVGANAPGVHSTQGQGVAYREITRFRSVGEYTAFSGVLNNSTGGSLDTGVWVRDASGTRLVTATLGATGSQTPFYSTALAGVTETGRVVFNAEARDLNPSARIDAVGVWDQGEVTYLARRGERAPGTGTGVVFDRLTQNTGQATRAVAVSRTGATAIYGELSGPGVTTGNDTGVWVNRGAGTTLVMREGDAVPGSITGATVGSLASFVQINARGSVAFAAAITDPTQPGANLRGVFSDIDGVLATVAQTNDPAPGLSGTFQSFGQVAISKGDRTVFFASTGAQLSGLAGVWMRGASGDVEPVLLPGQVITLPDGSPLQIRFVDPFLINSEGNSIVNSREELALRVFGTNGRDAVVVVTIPSPAGGVMLAGAGIAALARRKRLTRGA